MSTWRHKAIKCLPGLKDQFQRKDLTIYDVFMELLPATITAHKENNQAALRSYYQFADWCMHQKTKDLWNAAGVGFYEHLGDQEETISEIELWINKDIYLQVRPLLAARLSPGKLQDLDKKFFPR
jgi:hypothetical protein